MKKKEAKELDAILDMFTPQSWIKEVSEAEMPACYKLAKERHDRSVDP